MAGKNGVQSVEKADFRLTPNSEQKSSSVGQVGGGARPQFDKDEANNLLKELKEWMAGRSPQPGDEEKEQSLRIDLVNGTLGPWARWFAVLWVVKEQCPGDKLSAWLNNTLGVAADGKGDDLSLVSVFRYRKGANVYEAGTGLVFRRLLTRLNVDRAARQLVELSAELLLTAESSKVSEADSFERFCHWVKEGTQLLPARIPDALRDAGNTWEKHAAVIKEIERVVGCRPTIGWHSDGTPKVDRAGAYINLYGQADSAMRRSIAAEIARRLQAAAQEHKPRLGVMYIDASATAMTRSVTPADVLDVMCKQLNIATLGPLHESGEAYDHAIDAVRKAIWRQEIVVLLDGLVHVSGVQAGLIKVMADRDWDAFMRTLSQPDAASLGKPTNWISAVVAFSDGPLIQSAEWTCLQERIGTLDDEHARNLAVLDVVDVDAIAMLMVAASVDGLRQATLQRSLKRWCDAVNVEDSWAVLRPLAVELKGVDVTALCDRLVANSNGMLLDAVAKATVPGLEPRQRRYELQLDPHSTEEADAPADAAGRPAATQRLLTFRTEHERRAFLVGHFDSLERGNNGRAERDLAWWSLNWVLAEEALAQATGALRRTSTSVGSRARGYRRLLQALHHALLSGPVEPTNLNDKSRRPSEYWLMGSMPTSHSDRLRYCFASIYSAVIEGEEWLLSRSLGRSDVRVGLLAMFIAKDPRDLIRADADGDVGAFVQSVREGWLHSTGHCTQPHRELLEEIMLSLATAAVDSENDEIANCCIAELRGLGPRMEERVNALRLEWPEVTLAALEPGWGRRASERARDLIKLELDLLDSDDQVSAAIRLCNAEIVRLAGTALDVGAIWKLAADHGKELYRANLDLPRLSRELDAFVDKALTNLRNRPRRWSVVGALIDLLARLADYAATISDKRADVDRDEDSAAYRKAIRGFVTSWSYFYVSDGLRVALALGRSDGRKWQSISARPYRVYVRVGLKISRLVSDSAVRLLKTKEAKTSDDKVQQAQLQLGVAKAFLAHSQERANVYARTFHRYIRERFQSILLQATIVRCWASYAAAEQKIQGAASATTSLASFTVLLDALDYVERAERVLLELEAPDLLGRRLLLERVSILIGALHSLDGAGVRNKKEERARLKLLVETYLGALIRVTRTRRFWSRLADRQLGRWTDWIAEEKKAEERRSSALKIGVGTLDAS